MICQAQRQREEQNVDLPSGGFQSRIILNTDAFYHRVIEESYSLGKLEGPSVGRGCLSCILRTNRGPAVMGGAQASQTVVPAVQRHRGLQLYDVPRNPPHQ